MKAEDKDLLLKDLCARLPYSVKVFYEYVDDLDKKTYGYSLTLNTWCIDELVAEKAIIKPYLRPMSSMTEEEKKEYDSFLFDNLEREDVIGYEDKAFGIDVIMRYRSWDVVQWLLEHHFDFNGLIDIHNLALEAPKDMYKI